MGSEQMVLYVLSNKMFFFSGPWFIVSIVQGSEGPPGNRCQNKIGTFVTGQDESL